MKKLLLSFMLVLLLAPTALRAQKAQEELEMIVAENSDNSSGTLPFLFSQQKSWVESIYPKNVLGNLAGQSCTINSIAYRSNSGSNTYSATIKIYMAETEQSVHEYIDNSYYDDWIPKDDYDLVFEGEVQLGGNGWVTFELKEPFEYSGENNISIAVSKSGTTTSKNMKFFYSTFTTSSSDKLSIWKKGTSEHPGEATATSSNKNLPETKLGYTVKTVTGDDVTSSITVNDNSFDNNNEYTNTPELESIDNDYNLVEGENAKDAVYKLKFSKKTTITASITALTNNGIVALYNSEGILNTSLLSQGENILATLEENTTYYLVAAATDAFTVTINKLTEGDVKENAIEVESESLPYVNEINEADYNALKNDYSLLDGGIDIVYKLNLSEESIITATATNNAIVKLYPEAEAFNEALTPENGKYTLEANTTYYLVAAATEAFTVNISEYIAQADTWQNAVTITEFPFNDTPEFEYLENDYQLPGTTTDGKDAVYKLTLEKATKIDATVSGANGKIAVYAENFNGEENPGKYNYYGAMPTEFSEDFESFESVFSNWDIIDKNNDGETWERINRASYQSPDYEMMSYSYLKESCLNTDDYIKTKSKYLITSTSTLSWYINGVYTVYGDRYAVVFISEDGTENTVYTSTTNKDNLNVTLTDEILREYDGQSVYIAFRHYESTAAGLYGIYLDDIVLSDGSSKSSKNVQANNKIEGLELHAGTYYIAASATEQFSVNIKEYVAPGDTWQNAVDVTEFPFSHEPDFAYLKENYELPGETDDGADVVYRLTLDEPTTINASVTGTNGKIAVYKKADVEENGGITATNNIQVEEEQPEEGGGDSGEGGEVLFECDFDDESDLVTHFNIYDVDEDGENFEQTVNGSTDSGVVISWSYYLPDNDNTPDNVILTKESFLIKEGTTLTYDVLAGDPSCPEHYSIVISEDGTTFIDVVEYDINADEKGRTYTFTNPAYVGKTVYLGFRHFGCENCYYIEFDNIILTDGSSKSSRATATDSSIEGLELPAGNYYIAASATEAFTVNIDSYYTAKVDENSYTSLYTSLEGAVNAAGSGATVTLLKNASGNEFTINGKNITIDFAGHDYTVGSYITITANSIVRLKNGTFKTSEGSAVSIAPKSQLYLNTDTKGDIRKYVEPSESGWGTMSSPVGTIEISEVTNLTNQSDDHDMYRYNEAAELWENVKVQVNGFTNLEKGRGYLYANGISASVQFTGTFSVADVEYPLSYTPAKQLRGFNMVGNPFTHDIDITNFSGATLAGGTFYNITEDGGWLAAAEGKKIAPMEAVLLKTNEEATLTISNEVPADKSRGENNGMLQINVSNSQYNDVAYVSFNKGLGLDKISHRNAEIPMVYVPVDGTNYAVAMMDKDVTEVPVSFKAMTMGEYTIGAKALDCEFEQMTLVDRLTGESTNLLLEDYTFMARSNDNPSRFVIYLTGKDNADINSEIFVFQNNDELVINNISGNAVVRIIDIMGRPVAEYNVSGSANISTASFANGVYMIQMSDENGVKVQKVVID